MTLSAEKIEEIATVKIRVGHGKTSREILVRHGFETDRNPREFTHIPEDWEFTPVRWNIATRRPERWRFGRKDLDNLPPTNSELPPISPAGDVPDGGEVTRTVSQYEGITPPKDIGVQPWQND